MNRRIAALILPLLAAGPLLAADFPARPLDTARGKPFDVAQGKPNIILIMTDDQGYGDLACHGNPIIQTPNIDRLHGEAVRFTDFHVSPTCSPTRSALMTGRHEFFNGVTINAPWFARQIAGRAISQK